MSIHELSGYLFPLLNEQQGGGLSTNQKAGWVPGLFVWYLGDSINCGRHENRAMDVVAQNRVCGFMRGFWFLAVKTGE